MSKDDGALRASELEQSTHELSPTLVTAILSCADAIRQRGATALFVYGSRARGDNRPDSDLDIFVDYDRASEFSLVKLAGIKRLIEGATGMDVHITTASSVPAAARNAVARDAVRVI